jgi:hypothetical protein
MTMRDFSSQRRRVLLGIVALGAGSVAVAAKPQRLEIQVWKDPNCGCCTAWIEHLEKNGFSATIFDTGNNAVRARLGLPQKFASCHTGLIQGYVIEGHVPAADIRRLIKEKPDAIGVSVPGMPIGTPGMDGADYGGQRDPYQVLLIQKNGSSRVFNSYSGG